MAEYIEKTLITTELPFVMMKYGNYFNERQIEKIVEIVYELENSIEAADVQPTNRWISVDEALPIYDGLVLVVDKNNTIRLGMYTELGWTSQFGNPMITYITHWQPLPEPPKDGDTNDRCGTTEIRTLQEMF